MKLLAVRRAKIVKRLKKALKSNRPVIEFGVTLDHIMRERRSV